MLSSQKANSAYGLLGDYLHSLESVRCGQGKKDKLKILVNRGLYASYILNLASYRAFGRPLFEPKNLLRGYRCKYGDYVFACPGGNSELQFLENFEPDVKQIVSRFRNGDAVDVGAGFGLYSVILSKSLGGLGKVLAIEPDLSHFSFMARNIAINDCKNVIALNVAAWSKASKLKIRRHVFGGPFQDSISEEQMDGVVDARPLDQICLDFGVEPTLVKIDVEGAEYEVLSGMENTLRLNTPIVVFEALTKQTLANCSSLLEKMNYVVSPLPDGNFLARVGVE